MNFQIIRFLSILAVTIDAFSFQAPLFNRRNNIQRFSLSHTKLMQRSLVSFPVNSRLILKSSSSSASSDINANRVSAPNNSPHLIILPGFGNADSDYTNPFGAGADRSIQNALERRGFKVHVMPLKVCMVGTYISKLGLECRKAICLSPLFSFLRFPKALAAAVRMAQRFTRNFLTELLG